MKIDKITIKGFRSFGPEGETINLTTGLGAFIGINSSGKTAAFEALRKVFGSTNSERAIYRQDFHIAKGESASTTDSKSLSIEVRFSFDDKEDGIPHFFEQMVVKSEGAKPFVRLRLEASWEYSAYNQEGDIDIHFYFVRVPEGEIENDSNKRPCSNHLRSLVQVLYVPAIRHPADQIRYVSGTILHRVLNRITWEEAFKSDFEERIQGINDAFKGLAQFGVIQSSISEFWKKFHRDARYRDATLGFGGSDLDSVLRKFEISFTPSGVYKPFGISELGEGYRSMFYLTLVCALLEVEEKLASTDSIGADRPLLTLLAIEEPENHIAPQLLGRTVAILKTISEKDASQVIISSHSASIVKRLEPESILHFRITEKEETQVNGISLPTSQDEAYQFIKQALFNYPELYFARLVVIGEGDSEEVIFNRLMDVSKVEFDDNLITFAPLGHRFVNHIWKLLTSLNIPHVTLLDLDTEREGGGWGRIKYALKQLIENGVDKKDLLLLSDDSVLSDEQLKVMHTWKFDASSIRAWLERLESFNVFYSRPLDIDYLMLEAYPEFYKAAIPKNGGPQIPNKEKEALDFNKKVDTAVQATLKSEKAKGDQYAQDQKELMLWYNYHFLGRGKPSTHMTVMAKMSNKDIQENIPKPLEAVFQRISDLLKSDK